MVASGGVSVRAIFGRFGHFKGFGCKTIPQFKILLLPFCNSLLFPLQGVWWVAQAGNLDKRLIVLLCRKNIAELDRVRSAPEANGKVSYDHGPRRSFHMMNSVLSTILDAGASNLQATRRDPLSKLSWMGPPLQAQIHFTGFI